VLGLADKVDDKSDAGAGGSMTVTAQDTASKVSDTMLCVPGLGTAAFMLFDRVSLLFAWLVCVPS